MKGRSSRWLLSLLRCGFLDYRKLLDTGVRPSLMYRLNMSDTHLAFAEEALPDFVCDFASTKIAPGSGAAAAIVLGLAASCAAKGFPQLEKILDTNRKYVIETLSADIAVAQDFRLGLQGR
jgi:hypothetical protein